MSTQRKAEFSSDPVSEQSVHDYLRRHPDFFEQNSDLLGSLRLPHVAGGTVSLVERQVSVLRQKDMKLERKLKDLIDVARSNDVLAAKIHKLTLALMAAGNLQRTLSVLESALRTGFDADQSILVLFGDREDFSHIKIGRFLLVVDRDNTDLKTFNTFLSASRPRCGQVRDAQRDFLFGHGTDEIGSAAMVPLGRKADLGFLAIGSADSKRFHPGMSLDFLTRLGELVTGALNRY